jgi:hypothetical protein
MPVKAMFAGFAAMIVISVGAWYGLGQAGFSTQDSQAGQNVRLD